MKNILKDNGTELWGILKKINSYNIDSKIRSLQKTIKHFSFSDIYTEILDFMENSIEHTEELERYFQDNIIYNNDTVMRFKAEASLRVKWDKNLEIGKQLREVCNDILGIRIITCLNQIDLINEINDILKSNIYKVNVVNFYISPKIRDDGYRGIHLYFRDNPRCFPIELQFWTRRDWLLNKYTHEVIYKQNFKQDHILDYPQNLRNWIDQTICLKNQVKF